MANNMTSVVIGDEFFVAGFLYGGFHKGIVIKDGKDARIKIDEVIEDGNAGLIVVEKALVIDADHINRVKSDASKPLIVEIDGDYRSRTKR